MKKSLVLFALCCSYAALAADEVYRTSQTDFGGTGLMQMPSGRMDQEGAFHLNGFYNNEYYRYSVSVQLMPWLESTLRYTDVRTKLYSNDPGFSGDNTLKDKGIDVKFRLLQESYWLPETSLGLRDIGGTGLFDGEYLAASKRVGPVDFTLGLGWGYLGQQDTINNPFCTLSDGYCERPGGFGGNGGQIDSQRMFKGETALFGGIEYQTPWQSLVLKLEYDGNDYQHDVAGVLPQDSPFNIGAVYRFGKWGDLHVSYQRGNTLSLGFSIGSYFNNMDSVWLDEPKPAVTSSRAIQSKDEWQSLAQKLERNAGYRAPQLYRSGKSIVLVGEQIKYRDRQEAIERASSLLLSATDEQTETFRIIETQSHLPMAETLVDRKSYQEHVQALKLNTQLPDALSRVEPRAIAEEQQFSADDRLSYTLSPELSQAIGGPENNYLFRIGLKGSVHYWLQDNLKFDGSLYLNLFNNYDQFNFIVPPDGTDQLRVRTLARDYIDQRIRLTNLQVTWQDHLAENFYGQIYAGYLESMFGGIGGEILYRPLDSRWAIGLDANYVSQRDPNNPLGFFNEELQYSEVDEVYYRVAHRQVVGNLALYYQPEWHVLENTLLKVSIGRYLAGDQGATLDFSKQFNSGVIVGAYASKTDMSVEEFGEGSFTKGFYISIPFDVLTIKPSLSRAMIEWQPITRDGGQQLNRSTPLYEMTDARSPWYSRAKQ